MRLKKFALVFLAVFGVVAGCSQAPVNPQLTGGQLAERARGILIFHTHSESPLMRSHAIEAMADVEQSAAISLVLEALNDDYWGVRFTACMAIMQLEHTPATPLLLRRLDDPDKSVQAAAVGALHVLGDRRHTSRLGQLLFDRNVVVRRNTATVLGRMGDPEAVKLLRQALRDDDLSVRLQVLEAMSLLRNDRATRLMINYCRSAFDDESSLAILTLGRAQSYEAKDQIGYVYETSKSRDRLGMRLIAARSLAMMGDHRGQSVALSALRHQAKDPQRTAIIRSLAAMTLGEIGSPSALGALEQALDDESATVQIASSSAILKILRTGSLF